MRIVLISTPIGFLGSGKGGGVELTLNSLVRGKTYNCSMDWGSFCSYFCIFC